MSELWTLEGTLGPVQLEIGGEWKGVEVFDPVEETVFEEEPLKRREVILPVKQFREVFGD